MPMIDAHIPENALLPEEEAQLLKNLTDILIRLEGFDPGNERARAATWIFLHRPKVFVAGTVPDLPRYRFFVSVPEGQYDDTRRESVVREMTEAVAAAEGQPFAEVSPRVWIFPFEIPDGQWGGRGGIRRLPEIVGFLAGDNERQRAVERLAEHRRRAASAILTAMQVPKGKER